MKIRVLILFAVAMLSCVFLCGEEPGLFIQTETWRELADIVKQENQSVFRFCCGGDGEHLNLTLPKMCGKSFSWAGVISPDGIPCTIKFFTAGGNEQAWLAYEANQTFTFSVKIQDGSVSTMATATSLSDA